MSASLADPGRLTLVVLPMPNRAAYARIGGFCGGHLVGETESRSGGAPVPHWWPAGEPQPITHPAQKRIAARRSAAATHRSRSI